MYRYTAALSANLLLYSYQNQTQGSLPLHEAAKQGQCFDINILATTKNVNRKDNAGETPLHYAAQFNQMEAIACLLRLGADSTLTDNHSRTPRYYLKLELRNHYDKLLPENNNQSELVVAERQRLG